MSLEERFYEAVDAWSRHCKENAIHSAIAPYLDCDAYRKIISMGEKVLPLIRNELLKPQRRINDPGVCWYYAIKEIVPEFNLHLREREGRSPVKKVVKGFCYDGLNIDRAQETALRWLNSYLFWTHNF